jgi:hypothetical protein
MALETMSWAASDCNTLTFTAYTFGRGFADYHRAFAQAFLALPDIPGTTAAGMPANVTARTYVSGSKTYVGVAFTGNAPQTLTLNIPGSWPAYASVTDLVANQTTTTAAGSSLPLSIAVQPMQLNSFLVEEASGAPPPNIIYNYAGASM